MRHRRNCAASGRWRTVAGACANLMLVGLSLAMVEVACRYGYDVLIPPEARGKVEIALGQAGVSRETGRRPDGTASSEIEIRPYYLYINKPGSETYGKVQVNSEGYRGPDVAREKPAGTLRVLALGGSTTYGWPLPDYQDAWPYQLQTILTAQLGQPVEVLNAGLPGGLSSETLIAYLLRDRYYQPDFVVVHDGGNDVEPLFYGDYRPDYANFRAVEGNGLALRPGEAALLRASATARVLYSWWFRTVAPTTLRARPVTPVTPEEAARNVARNEPLGYGRNLEMLVSRVVQDGATPIIFPFLYAPDDVFKALPSDARYAEPTLPAARAALAKNIGQMRRVAQAYNAPMVELAPEKIPPGAFLDQCHLKADGERVKAQFVADTITDLLSKRNATPAQAR